MQLCRLGNCCDTIHYSFKTSRSRQSGSHFPKDIFKIIFRHENGCIWFKCQCKLSLKLRLRICKHWFRQPMGRYLAKNGLIYWRIYAFDLEEGNQGFYAVHSMKWTYTFVVLCCTLIIPLVLTEFVISINSLTLERYNLLIFKLIPWVSICCETAVRWMPQELTDDQSTLV